MNPQQIAQQQQLLAIAQQMRAQNGAATQPMGANQGAYLTLQQQQSIAAMNSTGCLSPEKQAQLAMAHQMVANQRAGGGMNALQQQQMAMQHQQNMAMAQQMSAQYAATGMTPQQQQQMAMGQPVTANPYAPQAAPVYPQGAPVYPPAAPATSAASTIITVTFPDGCMIGYDRLRNELLLNGKLTNTKMNQMPARPSPDFSALTGATSNEPAVPVEKAGMMTKLGWKKNAFVGESWQNRYFRLTDTSISYYKDPSSPPISVIPLNHGITVAVVNASTPARKNRYEHNEGIPITAAIGSLKAHTSGVVGRDNCVEMIVPPQFGKALDSLMANSVVGLAFGGGAQDVRKQTRGRTYYMSCASRLEADEWCNAIANNVRALPAAKRPAGHEIGGANGYSGMDAMTNGMKAFSNTMNDMFDPAKSLTWYMTTLGTQVPVEQVYALLDAFYNDLDRANVPHP